jgi:hypothetical protein
MKKLSKYILISSLSLFLIFPFLIPISKAQEFTYNGVDTEHIPSFFVYPSERYYYNYTAEPIVFREFYMRFDIVKGNISNTYMGSSSLPGFPPLVNGSCIFGDIYQGNATTSQEELLVEDQQIAYWNETVGLICLGIMFLPVDETGEATAQSIEAGIKMAQWSTESLPGTGRFEHNASFPSIYSFELWNSSNNAYYKFNFTENGHQIKSESFKVPNSVNITLMSKPPQQSPQFNLLTESGNLVTDTNALKLVADITDADNNNDKSIDTDYSYRIYNGTEWTAWAPVTSVIDYDLGPVAKGNYDITMEVKNMYGSSSDAITIKYNTAGGGSGGIPGYSTILIPLAIIIGISYIYFKNRERK